MGHDWEDFEIEQANTATYSRDLLRRLTTVRALALLRGTIFHNRLMVTEQIVVLLLACVVATVAGLISSVREHLVDIETVASTLLPTLSWSVTLFLGTYLGLSVGRWWRLRTAGIGTAWAGMLSLVSVIGQCVTQEKWVLSAIERYARASLQFIFLKRRGVEDPLGTLRRRGLLLEEEVLAMGDEMDACLSECFWVFTAGILADLWREGKISSPALYQELLLKADTARTAIVTINAQLGTPVPFQYVHLLSVLVKVHNLALGLCNGALASVFLAEGRYVMMVATLLRSQLMSCVFTSVLLMSQELQFPFDGYASDFPMLKYDTRQRIGATKYGEVSKTWPKVLKALKSEQRHSAK